jgi:hypothetical protein
MTEALYAGDLLQVKYSQISSFSLTEEGVFIRFTLPMQMFGLWERVGDGVLILTKDSFRLSLPWWVWGNNRKELRGRLSKIPTEEHTIEGLFRRGVFAVEEIAEVRLP